MGINCYGQQSFSLEYRILHKIIYEMNHILNGGYEIKKAMILAVMDAIFATA